MTRLGTKIVRGAWIPAREPATLDIVPPIHVSAIYLYPPADKQFKTMRGELKYSRENNPTTIVLEEALAAIEGGSWCLAFNSGMAAIATLITALSSRSTKIVVSRLVYGSTRRLLEDLSGKIGFELVAAGPPWSDLLDAAEKSDLILVESISNPTLRIPPLDELIKIARDRESILVVDNTFASPALLQPLKHDATLVVESLTKYIAGHNDVLGGCIAGTDEQLLDALWLWRKNLGTILQPLEAYLALRGLKTLHIRVERMSRSAKEIAEWLETHPAVARVYYPCLETHPDYEDAKKLLPSGLCGAVVSFELRRGREAVTKFLKKLRLVLPSPSLGGTETVVAYPYESSHRDLPEEEKRALGITPSLLRLSVGLEDPEDIIEDLAQALEGL